MDGVLAFNSVPSTASVQILTVCKVSLGRESVSCAFPTDKHYFCLTRDGVLCPHKPGPVFTSVHTSQYLSLTIAFQTMNVKLFLLRFNLHTTQENKCVVHTQMNVNTCPLHLLHSAFSKPYYFILAPQSGAALPHSQCDHTFQFLTHTITQHVPSGVWLLLLSSSKRSVWLHRRREPSSYPAGRGPQGRRGEWLERMQEGQMFKWSRTQDKGFSFYFTGSITTTCLMRQVIE